MAIEVITKEDLQEFKIQLLHEMKEVLHQVNRPQTVTPWLRSSEVRRMLKISAGTLQNLRVHGKIQSSKVGNLHYYRQEDIEKLLDSGFALK